MLARAVTIVAGLTAGALVLSGWWCAGVGWRGGERAGSAHVWVGRGRVEVFDVPYGACGLLPPVGVVLMRAEDLLSHTGELGNYIGEDGGAHVPLAARWRWDARGGVRGGWAIPVWPAALALAGWSGALWLRGRWRRRGVGECMACGYSQEGLAPGARCPECGGAGSARYHRARMQETT